MVQIVFVKRITNLQLYIKIHSSDETSKKKKKHDYSRHIAFKLFTLFVQIRETSGNNGS